jgi:hypothetical protein
MIEANEFTGWSSKVFRMKMKTSAHHVTLGFLSLAFLIPAGWLFLTLHLPAGQTLTVGAPCSASEYRQFDFWLGDWDTFDSATGKPDARVRVTSILNGCVLHEDYQAVDGHKGESFTIYDATRKLWHQTWVTDHGRLLEIEGHFQSGAMTLSGSDLTPTGEHRQIRGTWKRLPDGAVQETAFSSADDGKTWLPWFDLVFRPHKG